MRKKQILSLVIFLIFGMGLRIYSVNARAVKPVYEYYSIGEWIPYDSAYLIDKTENTKGYYARVLNATFVTYKEYMEKYDLPLDTLLNVYSNVYDGNLTEEKIDEIYNIGMIDVTMEYHNDSSNDGHIALSESKIFAPNDNIYYTICESVLDLQEPKLAGEMGYFFQLIPNGESIILHVPYILPIYSNGYIGQETGNFPKHLTITLNPVRKFVEIPLKK